MYAIRSYYAFLPSITKGLRRWVIIALAWIFPRGVDTVTRSPLASPSSPASSWLISVDMHAAGRVRRTMPKGGQKHTVFRVGEPHGRITPRVEELVEMFSLIDSSKATANLWGERWSKLVQNGMGNGVTASYNFV